VGNAVIDGLLSGVAAGIILAIAGGIWQWCLRRANSEKFPITLRASSTLKPPKFKFGVLHVSNYDEKIINKVYWFKRHKDEWYASIRHPKNIGFQYKCFVDHDPDYHPWDVIKLLVEEGYEYPTVGAGIPNRVWFILKGKPTAKDSHRNTNNHYYPR
jgi:hypothetical protein